MIYTNYMVFTPNTKKELQNAVDLWCLDKESAVKKYGEINTWNTVNIKSMSDLFRSCKYFDDNINNWLDSNGKPLIASVPKNPVGGTGINSYYINISTTDSTSYAIYSKLTSGQFYCIQNGTSSTVTAATDCIPL